MTPDQPRTSGPTREALPPAEPRLAGVAEELGRARLAAELFDPDWTMVWVSPELKVLLGEEDELRIGYGTHCLQARSNEFWNAATTQSAKVSWSEANLGFVLYETPGEVLRTLAAEILDGDPRLATDVEPGPAPLTWSYELVYNRPGFQPMRISCLSIRLNDSDCERIGTANIYSPALPARMLDLLARGDERMFERMARLIVPGRRSAAIMFADLQASGTLSRRLPSATYFRLIRSLTTAIDDVVGEFGGIVGKHAGDGVTAFFLAEEMGSPSGAARSALQAAAGIATATALTVSELGGDGAPIETGDVLVNVGIHWGGALYMGQVVTGGRLEVTALGDEVNEAARIQQAARDGAAYASKAVIERLMPEDAEVVGIDPDSATYRTISDLPGVDAKSVRDAGGIAVTELPRRGPG